MGSTEKEEKSPSLGMQIKAQLKKIFSHVDLMTDEQQALLLKVLKNWDQVQKRKYPRKPFSAPVDYAVGDRAYSGMIKNISAGGVFIEAPEDMDVGETITLTFSIPGQDKPLKSPGKIVWKEALTFGVKFLGTTEYLEQHLAKLIDALPDQPI